jgi:hypothetical protein
MHAVNLKKLALSVITAGALLGAAVIPAATAQAATSPAAVAAAKAQWQSAIAKVPEQGAGCYQAAYPALSWHSVACVTAPNIPLVPKLAHATAPHAAAGHAGPETIGDGSDYSAVVSGLISKATGTFSNVSSNISESGQNGGTGASEANSFSLQLNTQFFSGSPACSRASDPSQCQAWQQFVYTYNGDGTGDVFMQYWLINYNNSCPSGWYSYSPDCYTNSNATEVNEVTAQQLGSVKLGASAVSGGNDSVSLSVGSGQASTVTGKDTKIGLASFWNTTEWGVFGNGGGGAANFGSGNSLTAVTALTSTSSAAPSCVEEGFTGETNNLTLTSTPAISASSPTLASAQTDGSAGNASCATAG